MVIGSYKSELITSTLTTFCSKATYPPVAVKDYRLVQTAASEVFKAIPKLESIPSWSGDFEWWNTIRTSLPTL